jgi:hypothetical protein
LLIWLLKIVNLGFDPFLFLLCPGKIDGHIELQRILCRRKTATKFNFRIRNVLLNDRLSVENALLNGEQHLHPHPNYNSVCLLPSLYLCGLFESAQLMT